ncbi:MAG: glycosyltransferase family 2 protein [Bacteroidales bacterium]|nr:glycosyltransferase family 2 protein [Bacteroidales bacterium]
MQGKEASVCVLIPTYNNASTLGKVVEGALSYCPNLIVVNDGSSDGTSAVISGFSGRISSVSYDRNRGKGHALRVGQDEARRRGFRYAITMDSDGQHFPEEIPHFIETLNSHPDSLIVGSRNLQAERMPGRNSFANRFSNFWFRLQTGISLPDTQTGYRLYPLDRLPNLHLMTARYEAELMLLVASAWKNVPLLPMPIKVYYPPEGERVSHFKPFADFFRISLLNAGLTIVALFFIWPLKLFRKIGGRHD